MCGSGSSIGPLRAANLTPGHPALYIREILGQVDVRGARKSAGLEPMTSEGIPVLFGEAVGLYKSSDVTQDRNRRLC